MVKKKIKALSESRYALLNKRKIGHRNVEGTDFYYTEAGNKRPTPATWMNHFDSRRHGCELEVLEDGRIYTTSKSSRGPKGGVDKPS